jgi:hypothetical protein
MAHRLGVLVLHGMGDQQPDFASALIEDVNRRLEHKAAEVCWQPVWWAPILVEREKQLLDQMQQGGPLRWGRLRNFVVNALGDAIAYQRVPGGPDRLNTYEAIHDTVARNLHELRQRIRDGQPADAPEVPLVVVAHSLGCHIISNHIWDLQCSKHPRQPKHSNPFERTETLAGIITFGCNIPLFTLAYNELHTFNFPRPDLLQYFKPGTTAEQLNHAAQWLNLYDPDDVLGFPLKTLSADHERAVSKDEPVNAGNLAVGATPLSHSEYWECDEVTRAIAKLVRGLLHLL